MSWLRRRRALITGVAVAGVIAVGIWLAIALSGGNERNTFELLNKPTDARRHRPLRPGPTPGFTRAQLEREKHGESEAESESESESEAE